LRIHRAEMGGVRRNALRAGRPNPAGAHMGGPWRPSRPRRDALPFAPGAGMWALSRVPNNRERILFSNLSTGSSRPALCSDCAPARASNALRPGRTSDQEWASRRAAAGLEARRQVVDDSSSRFACAEIAPGGHREDGMAAGGPRASVQNAVMMGPRAANKDPTHTPGKTAPSALKGPSKERALTRFARSGQGVTGPLRRCQDPVPPPVESRGAGEIWGAV